MIFSASLSTARVAMFRNGISVDRIEKGHLLGTSMAKKLKEQKRERQRRQTETGGGGRERERDSVCVCVKYYSDQWR